MFDVIVLICFVMAIALIGFILHMCYNSKPEYTEATFEKFEESKVKKELDAKIKERQKRNDYDYKHTDNYNAHDDSLNIVRNTIIYNTLVNNSDDDNRNHNLSWSDTSSHSSCDSSSSHDSCCSSDSSSSCGGSD